MELTSFSSIIPSLKNLYFIAKNRSWGEKSGIHISRQKDFNEDFYETQKYSIGVPSKYIDWKKYAQTQKLYTKVGTKKVNQKILIYLDSSMSQKVTLQKYNMSWLLALGIAYILKKQHDTIMICTDDSIFPNNQNIFEIKTEKDFYIIDKIFMENSKNISLKLRQTVSIPTMLEKLYSQSGVHKVIWITDLYFSMIDFKAILSYFQEKKYYVSVFHIVDSKEYDFSLENKKKWFGRFFDVETKQWVSAYKMKEYKTIWENAIKKRIKAILNRNFFYFPSRIQDGPIKIISESHLI